MVKIRKDDTSRWLGRLQHIHRRVCNGLSHSFSHGDAVTNSDGEYDRMGPATTPRQVAAKRKRMRPVSLLLCMSFVIIVWTRWQPAVPGVVSMTDASTATTSVAEGGMVDAKATIMSGDANLGKSGTATTTAASNNAEAKRGSNSISMRPNTRRKELEGDSQVASVATSVTTTATIANRATHAADTAQTAAVDEPNSASASASASLPAKATTHVAHGQNNPGSAPKQQLQDQMSTRLQLPHQLYLPTLDDIRPRPRTKEQLESSSTLSSESQPAPPTPPTFSDFCKAHNKPGYRFAPLVDKHAIKHWVASIAPDLRIAQEYANIVRTNISALSDDVLRGFPSSQFLMKAAHTSGCISSISLQEESVQCLKKPCLQRKSTESLARFLQRLCRKYLQTNYGIKYKEGQYDNIPRRCVLEERLDVTPASPSMSTATTLATTTTTTSAMLDYKIHTFHGRPMLIVVYGNRFDGDRKLTRNARTPRTWLEVPIPFDGDRSVPTSRDIERPAMLDHLLNVTQRLVRRANVEVASFPYVRMDYFVYPTSTTLEAAFAEMTFTHANCGPIFDRNHAWANQFYGFVGQHPEHDVPPDSILRLLEQERQRES